jgi:hypothetical protein
MAGVAWGARPLRVDVLIYCVVDVPNMSTTVRVSEETRQRAAAIAKATGRQLQQVIEQAVIAYERELFWQQMAKGYEALPRTSRLGPRCRLNGRPRQDRSQATSAASRLHSEPGAVSSTRAQARRDLDRRFRRAGGT